MKAFIALLFGALWFNAAMAQTKTYESKISATQCVRITVTKAGGNASVHYETIPFNGALKSSIFNEVGAEIVGKRLTVPSKGSFWVVPFDGTPVQSIGGFCWDWDCECNSSGGDEGGCQAESYFGGACISCTTNNHGNCTCCSLIAWMVDCGSNTPGSTPIRGGFVLVEANSVTVN